MKKTRIVIFVVSLLPLIVCAENAGKQAESFQSVCLSSWMKRINEISDKVSYKNFGEKYCGCALTQPLDTDADIDKAIQVCMARTLLHDTMDTIEDKVGLAKATEKDISESCDGLWNLIYPNMSEQAKRATTDFCNCARPKLADLLKNSDTMTDKDYYTQIDIVAATCSGMVKPEETPTKAAS